MRLRVYNDHDGLAVTPAQGNLTIGIGRNLTSRGITDSEANYLLANDIELAALGAKHLFGDFDTYTQNRRAALISLVFNMGLATLTKFTDTLAAIRAERWADAADDLTHSRWAHQVQTSRRDRIVKQIREG